MRFKTALVAFGASYFAIAFIRDGTAKKALRNMEAGVENVIGSKVFKNI